MADVPLRSVIRHLRHVLSKSGTWSRSDAELLEDFTEHRDGDAVEMLVWRHGTMVLNVCRRVLHDEHQAEDAFQATFLVFVRKAALIGKHQIRRQLALQGSLSRRPATTGQVGKTA